MPSLADLRRDLAAAIRLADRFGLSEGVCNHFSVAVPGEEDRYLVNPFGVHWSRMTASRILYCDGEGTVLDGDGHIDPTALHIHVEGHRARPDAVCILHTHMPYATALTCRKKGRLRFVHQNHLRFWERVAYHDDYGGLALEAEEGQRLSESASGEIVFLAHHGVIVHGRSVAEAWHDLYYLERACMVQVLAEAAGEPLEEIPGQVAVHTARQFAELASLEANAHFEALKDVIADEGPDFRA